MRNEGVGRSGRRTDAEWSVQSVDSTRRLDKKGDCEEEGGGDYRPWGEERDVVRQRTGGDGAGLLNRN